MGNEQVNVGRYSSSSSSGGGLFGVSSGLFGVSSLNILRSVRGLCGRGFCVTSVSEPVSQVSLMSTCRTVVHLYSQIESYDHSADLWCERHLG